MSKHSSALMEMVKKHGVDAAVEVLADIQRAKDLGREVEVRDRRARLLTTVPAALADAVFALARYQASTVGGLVERHRNQADKLYETLREGLGLSDEPETTVLIFEGTAGSSVTRRFKVANPRSTSVEVALTLSDFASSRGGKRVDVFGSFQPQSTVLKSGASEDASLALTIPQPSDGGSLRGDVRVWMDREVALTIPVRVVCR